MRLSHTEKAALDYAISGLTDKVYLFGSRTIDSKKGGDIDILIFSTLSAYTLSKSVAVKFFSRCESKIDVIVINPNGISPQQQAFINEISLIQLK